MTKFDKNKILFPLAVLLAACASMGTPDGGPFDEEPPILVSSDPGVRAKNVKNNKITLEFNENIKLENAFEKVVISPPQIEMPEIKANARKITVELFDSLVPGTTYTINFNDAVVDNNEGNPLENFSFIFSTGDRVDTLGVSGTVLNAEDLEPIKGILVGLHKAGDDSAFYKRPFERVSRTDSRGRFTITGVASGEYNVYALADANQNYLYDQKSEKIAFLGSTVEPYAMPAVRPDTVWRDSLTIDTIRHIHYTRLMPDDLVLLAFNEPFYSQYLQKSQRAEHNRFTLFFADTNDSLPRLKGLDFDADDAFVIEPSSKRDTITCWIKDSTIYHRDTLTLAVTYRVPDSLGVFVPRTDTVTLAPKKSRERVLKEQQEAYEKAEKAFIKAAKRNKSFDENNPPKYVPPAPVLKIKSHNSSTIDIDIPYSISFAEPLQSIDTAAIHVSKAINDSTYVPIPFLFRASDKEHRRYIVYAEWRPEEKYMVEIDSAAFIGLYGAASDKFGEKIAFRSLDSYAVLNLAIRGIGDNAIVQLLRSDGNVLTSQKTEQGRCTFYFIRPDKYYLRVIIDENGNGVWDTGDYASKVQPEKVYYYPHLLELKALFEYDQDDWDIMLPLNEQKPLDITKQKPDRERKKRNRNAERKFK